MTIADAPLWAQTPTAEIVRDINGSEPGPSVAMWHHGDGTSVAVDAATCMTVPEGRSVWESLGDLLAIEATQPTDTLVTAQPWEQDTDGSRSRFKQTPPVSAAAYTATGSELSVYVELYDDVNRLGRPDVLNAIEVVVTTDAGQGFQLKSAADARALAFALFKAAHVVDVATGKKPGDCRDQADRAGGSASTEKPRDGRDRPPPARRRELAAFFDATDDEYEAAVNKVADIVMAHDNAAMTSASNPDAVAEGDGQE